MTTPERVADLPASVRLPPGPIPEIPPPEALVCARRADDTPWAMAGRRARVVSDGLGGVSGVEGDGVPLVGRVEVVGGTGANLLVGPRCTRRELVLPGGSLTETVLVPDALPGAVLQWSAGAPGVPREVPVRLALAEGDLERVHVADELLWVGGPGRGLLLHAPGSRSVPRLVDEDGGLAVRWDLPIREGPATVLVLAAPEGEPWTSLPALAGVGAHHRRGELLARGEGEPGVELDTGVTGMDEGLAWSRAWLRNHLLAVPGRPPGIHRSRGLAAVGEGLAAGVGSPEDAPAWIARAAAAAGDREAARGALGELSWNTPWTRLHGALALARYVAWTGDGRPLEAAAPALLEVYGAPDALEGMPEAVVVAVHEAVVAAAEAVEVRELAALPRPAAAPARSRALPVLGATPGPPPGAGATHPWLAPLGFDPAPGAIATARAGLGAVATNPTVLGEGTGADAVLALVEGALGARPDATFARLGLSPCLPPSWTRFRARGLRVGDGSLELEWRLDAGGGTWTLRPREGSVPLTAVFEPWLPWAGLGGVRVDGSPAELDLEARGDWCRIRLQLPVDGPHTLEVEGVGPRAATLP